MKKIRKIAWRVVLMVAIACFGLMNNEQLVKAADPAPQVSSVEAYQAIGEQKCNFFAGCVEAGKDVTITLSGLAYNNGVAFPDGAKVGVRLVDTLGCAGWPYFGGDGKSKENEFKYHYVTYEKGKANITIPGSYVNSDCSYGFEVHLSNNYTDNPDGGVFGETKNNTTVVATSPKAQAQCSVDECEENLSKTAANAYNLCAQIKTGTPENSACMSCFSSGGIWTAIGCIPSKPESIIQVVITIGMAMGGGIVLIMILAGSFMLSVSQGDPNKTKEAKEMITSAIIGLLFVIFSITILQFIGVSILHIPGFGE